MVCCIIKAYAAFVKWYYPILPSSCREFDSRTPLHSTERTNNDNWECRYLFGMCNFIELRYHSAGRSNTVDQQPVASLLERPALELAKKHAICALCWSWQNLWTPFRQQVILRLVKWYHSWFGTKERKFDSCIGDQAMQRWRSGPTHGIANPKNRQFESDPLFQKHRKMMQWR